jgi:L-2-hydroxyglutarate oxidase
MGYDFCVIGGGIVGLATAMDLLARRPGASLLLLEKEAQLGMHQSGHNSGVIHAGVYYAPGSLKARLCRAGAEATRAFCRDHGIAFQTCGKLLVATSAAELARMDALQARAVENGLAVERLDADALHRREPNVAGLGALYVPDTGIVDYRRVCAAMAAQVRQAGGEIATGETVRAIDERPDGVRVDSDGRTLHARRLVACAGLQSDRLARLAGLAVAHRIVPFRGEFYRLPPPRAGIVRHLIYPVPDPSLPFLGIHLTRTIDGGVTVGPNAVLGFAREDYRRLGFDAADVVENLRFPGFWRSLRAHLRPGLREMRDSLWRRGYLHQCQRYCPSLRLEDLGPHPAGIRAQAVLRDGSFVHDFLLVESPRMLHVCNAPSPAATSAIPIGQMIAARVLARD